MSPEFARRLCSEPQLSKPGSIQVSIRALLGLVAGFLRKAHMRSRSNRYFLAFHSATDEFLTLTNRSDGGQELA